VSTSAGTPSESGNGRPDGTVRPRRDLRDSWWGRALALGLVLLVAVLVSRACTNRSQQVSQDEAMSIALEHATFTPCAREICRQIRYLQRGVPPVGYWAIVLSKHVDAQGQPDRIETFLVNATTGAVSTP
jgi:hypothetical protein